MLSAFEEGHFAGAGHVLAGQVLNPENMPHHQRNPAQLAGNQSSLNFTAELFVLLPIVLYLIKRDTHYLFYIYQKAEAARQRYAHPAAPADVQEPETSASVIHHNVLPLSQVLYHLRKQSIV